MKKKKGRARKQRELITALLGAGLAVLLTIVITFIVKNYMTNSELESLSEVTDIPVVSSYGEYYYIQYDGVEYEYNDNITTLLFLGIDQYSDEDERGCTDCMILVLLDEEKETATMLTISRNTMCDTEVVDEVGDFVTMYEQQITLQYVYGDGENESCELSCDAVSRLLYGIPIDYYLAIELDVIDIVVDNWGSISVDLEEDYTYIDEVFIEGTTVEMTGSQVESFVRYRSMIESGGNEERVLRQEIFLKAFMEELEVQMNRSTSAVYSVWDELSPYMYTNLYTDVIEEMLEYEFQEESYKVPGETILNGSYDEYYVEEDELYALLVELMYNKVA